MKNTIKYFLVFIIGIIIGGFLTFAFTNLNKTKPSKKELEIKESPYTLSELYEIIEKPLKFYELNKTEMNDFNKTIFHFYDYFNKSTPLKVAAKEKRNENGQISEIIEFDYISYYEFMSYMEEAYNNENILLSKCKKGHIDNSWETKCRYDYRYWVNELVYEHAVK